MYRLSGRHCDCTGCGCNTNCTDSGWNDAAHRSHWLFNAPPSHFSYHVQQRVNDTKRVFLCACVFCLAVSSEAYGGGISSCQLKTLMLVFLWNQTVDISIRPLQTLAVERRQKDNLVARPYEYVRISAGTFHHLFRSLLICNWSPFCVKNITFVSSFISFKWDLKTWRPVCYLLFFFIPRVTFLSISPLYLSIILAVLVRIFFSITTQ